MQNTDYPVYEMFLPSTKKVVKYRPFNAKEYKLLQMAKEELETEKEGSEESAFLNILQVIKNCFGFSDKDVERLAFFDIALCFVKLRTASVSNTIQLSYVCNNTVEAKKCGNNFLVKMGLDDIEVTFEEVDKTIQLDDKYFLRLRYPSFKVLREFIANTDDMDLYFKLLADCIDYKYTETDRFPFEDQQEKKTFAENLSVPAFKQLETFLEKQPYVRKETKIRCKKCSFEHHVVLSTFTDFFE